MGWKTRKDKIQSDSPAHEHSEPAVPVEAPAAPATAQSDTPAREPYVLDLDNDAFRTSASHTSLDPGAFSWYQAAPINVPGEADEAPKPARGAPTKPQSPVNGSHSGQFANGAHSQTPAPQQPANAFEEFGTPGSAFGDPQETYSAQPARNEPPRPAPASAAQDWSLTPVEDIEPLRFDAVSQYSEPAINTPPAFSDPQAPAWSLGDDAPAAAPQSGVPSIEQLMAPQQYEAPAPDPAVGRAPAIPDSYRPSTAQTQPAQSAPPIYAANSNHVRSGREDVAAGLVRQDNDLGIPRVAPFILDMGSNAEIEDPVEQPTLVIRFKNLAARYTITKDVITLGRPDSDTGNYPDVEIEMDEGVSRKHAEIRRKGGRHYLIDLGSTNGTLLNGQAVIALTENQLTHGDRIRIGEMTEIIFE